MRAPMVAETCGDGGCLGEAKHLVRFLFQLYLSRSEKTLTNFMFI